MINSLNEFGYLKKVINYRSVQTNVFNLNAITESEVFRRIYKKVIIMVYSLYPNMVGHFRWNNP
jgi:hypothetical protein